MFYLNREWLLHEGKIALFHNSQLLLVLSQLNPSFGTFAASVTCGFLYLIFIGILSATSGAVALPLP